MMNNQPKYYSVKDVHNLIFVDALSLTTVHKLVKNGDIPSTQYLKRRLIPSWWVEAELKKLSGVGDKNETTTR